MWLQLARWVNGSKLDANFLFAGLSGHELAKMGMEALLDSGELPQPNDVALWLHLGSGIAVQTPLLSAASSITALSDRTRAVLVANTSMDYCPKKKCQRQVNNTGPCSWATRWLVCLAPIPTYIRGTIRRRGLMTPSTTKFSMLCRNSSTIRLLLSHR